jgi:excisionase family DNA binding protein
MDTSDYLAEGKYQTQPQQPVEKPAQATPLMTVQELAKYLNVTKSTIYKMVTKKQIPFVRLGPKGRALRFKREIIEQWLVISH